MGCCGKKARDEDEVELQDMKHFKKHKQGGVTPKRKCRDLLCVCLFIAFWAGMFIIAAFSFSKGDPTRYDFDLEVAESRLCPYCVAPEELDLPLKVDPNSRSILLTECLRSLEYGSDSNGNVCGQNNIAAGVVPSSVARDLTGLDYLYFPLSAPSYLSLNLTGVKRICIASCPNTTSLYISDMICDYNVTASVSNAYVSCWPPYASTSILKFCVPTAVINETTSVFDTLNSRDFLAKVADDIKSCWKVVVVACVGALLVALLWLIMMRLFAGIAIWFCVWTVVLLLIGITAMFWLEGTNLKSVYDATPTSMQLSSDKTMWQAFLYTSYALCGVSAIVLIIVLFMCNRIHMAAMICEEASKAVASMFFQLVSFPIVPFLALVALGVYFVSVALFAFTVLSPDYSELETFTGLTQDNILKGLMLYHFFGLLWTFNWIIGIAEVTICGAVADWYWTFHGDKQKSFAVLRSFGRTLRYHLGSVAFGALLLGIIQFIRAIMLYFQAQMRGKENKLSRIALSIVNVILACFERFIRFLTKNAYVMIGVYGYSFCTSARRGFKIIVNNPLRVGAINCVNIFVMFLGKLFITLITTIAAFVYLKNYTNLNFYYFPLGFIAIWSFVVACIVVSIYDMAVHTILFCFVEDEARNDGSSDKPYHMSSDLQAFLDVNGGAECCCC